MIAPGCRRDFLRGLTTLPLIGGGVTLIGAPSAVAEPITATLLDSYDAWLFYERRFVRFERYGSAADRTEWGLGCDGRYVVTDTKTGESFDFVRIDNAGGGFHRSSHPREELQPSTRAALVLSAVGCDWRKGGRCTRSLASYPSVSGA